MPRRYHLRRRSPPKELRATENPFDHVLFPHGERPTRRRPDIPQTIIMSMERPHRLPLPPPRCVDAGGWRLRYREMGSGDPPLVLIHGLGGEDRKSTRLNSSH